MNLRDMGNQPPLNVPPGELAAEVERLQKVVEDQALTIGTLKDESGRWSDALSLANAKLGAVYVVLMGSRENPSKEFQGHVFDAAVKVCEDLETARIRLSDERSLTAATAAHTTALERKVAELQAREVEFKCFLRDLEFLIARHPDTREVPWNALPARIAAVRDFKLTPEPGAAT